MAVTPQWDKALVDPIAVIRCIPGVQSVEPEGPMSYAICVTTGIGPIRFRLEGKAAIESPDPHRWGARVTLHERLAGTIYGYFELGEAEEQMLAITADVTLGGRLGELAQPLLRKKAADMVRGFQGNFLNLLTQLNSNK